MKLNTHELKLYTDDDYREKVLKSINGKDEIDNLNENKEVK